MKLILLHLFIFLAVCSGLSASSEKDTLRVLVWNVWHGTNDVEKGPEKALQLIKDSKADICLLQESYDINGDRPQFGPWAAKQLGWNFWQDKSPNLCVISRYKIKKTFILQPTHALGAELEDDHGRTIHAFSIWIDSRSYTPHHLKNNPTASDEELLLSETTRSNRLKQVKNMLHFLEKESLTSLKTPLLIGGDWNCPSHLDWTKATSKAFGTRRALELPVSIAMHKTGFTDTFRTIHPNPIEHPGNTWSPLFRVDKENKPLPMDRIDRLYYKPNEQAPALKPARATVYPELLEDNDIPTLKRNFPSDHSALLIEFKWLTSSSGK